MAQIKDSRHADTQHDMKVKITSLTIFKKCFSKRNNLLFINNNNNILKDWGVSSPFYIKTINALEIPIRKGVFIARIQIGRSHKVLTCTVTLEIH